MRKRWATERLASGSRCRFARSRERVLAPPRPSPHRSRWTLATAVLAVAVCGAFGWRYFHGADAGTGGLDTADWRAGACAHPCHCRASEKGRLPGLSERTWRRGAVPDGSHPQPRRWRDRQNRLQARPNGQAGRRSRASRSASLSGGARPGAGEEDAGRGEPKGRAAQSCSATPNSPRRIPFRFSSSTPSRRPSIN